MRTTCLMAFALVAVTVFSGCVGDGEVKTSVFATHRIVRDLQANLGNSVTQLNQTAADLTAKVAENERQSRALQSMLEENQAKLAKLQDGLNKLTVVIYRDKGLTPPVASSAPARPDVAEVSIGVGPAPAVPPVPAPPPPEAPKPPVSPAPPVRTAPLDPGAAGVEPLPPAAAASNAVADFEKAKKSYRDSEYEKALKQYGEYLQKYPTSEYCHSAQFNKAQCYLRMEKYPEAITEFEKFRADYKSSPHVPAALNNQAAAYIRLNQTDKAIKILKDLVQNYPSSPAADPARVKLQELEGTGKTKP